MAKRVSARGAAEIIAHEAIVLSRYRDVVGVWTIGVGHTAQAGPPDPAASAGRMSLDAALTLFLSDLARYEARVARAFTRPLAQHEFDAAVSFDFNTGAIDRATWVETFNAGNRELAIEQIMNWKKPPQIIGRRRREQALFAGGRYESDGQAMLYPATRAGKVQWAKGRKVDVAGPLARLRPMPAEAAPDAAAPVPARRPPLMRRILGWLGFGRSEASRHRD